LFFGYLYMLNIKRISSILLIWAVVVRVWGLEPAVELAAWRSNSRASTLFSWRREASCYQMTEIKLSFFSLIIYSKD